MKYCFTNRLRFSKEVAILISLGGEFHNFGAKAENGLSKRDVLDLGTDK